jgi:hypothetical protein
MLQLRKRLRNEEKLYRLCRRHRHLLRLWLLWPSRSRCWLRRPPLRLSAPLPSSVTEHRKSWTCPKNILMGKNMLSCPTSYIEGGSGEIISANLDKRPATTALCDTLNLGEELPSPLTPNWNAQGTAAWCRRCSGCR